MKNPTHQSQSAQEHGRLDRVMVLQAVDEEGSHERGLGRVEVGCWELVQEVGQDACSHLSFPWCLVCQAWTEGLHHLLQRHIPGAYSCKGRAEIERVELGAYTKLHVALVPSYVTLAFEFVGKGHYKVKK